jgi:hypothetical protein
LGKIEIFKQAVQECPRRCAARKLMRRKLRFCGDVTDAGGINVKRGNRS